MPITCQVTGQITDIFSVSLEVVTLEFTHKESEPFISGSGALVSLSPKRVKCVGGVIDVALVPGEYSVRILDTRSTRELAVRIGVPNTATAALADIVEAPVPKRLDAAEEAVLDARSARDAAIEAADTATTKATEVEENASATLTAKNAAEAASVLAEASKNTAVAAQSAANLSATAAEEKAVEASSSAGNAANSATSASESASAAEDAANAAAYSESASATSASNANISATSAANSATSASTSKDSAATSAAASASSATSAGNAVVAAQAARDATLAALDSFDDRYLGAFAEEPSVDNDGKPLQKGALFYHDAAENAGMRVYTGSIWVPAYSSLDGALLVENNLSDLADAVQSRQNLGMGAGDDVHFSSVTANLFGNASTATLAVASTKLQSARNILLSGGVTGSASFDGSSDVTLNVQVADNSHAHTIANVTGLQNALDLKLDTSGNAASATKLADPFTLSVSGGASGSVSLDGSGDVALDLSLESLPALSATISDASAVVAKCIFSLADMSDGGAAIRNARHTSWHQAWGPFPEKFGVYATTSSVTIRDLTKAGAPVWGVPFIAGASNALRASGYAVTSVKFAADGCLIVGNQNGLFVFDFPKNRVRWLTANATYGGYWYDLTTANSGVNQYFAGNGVSLPVIGHTTVNAVASFTYPDAPCDPATGLPVATIAVGHSAGVSIIKADGTVANKAQSSGVKTVAFDDLGNLFAGYSELHFHFIRAAGVRAGDLTSEYVAAYLSGAPVKLPVSAGTEIVCGVGGKVFARGIWGKNGVVAYADGGGGSMYAATCMTDTWTDTQFSGLVGSWLNSSDDADLVGGDKCVNGAFASNASGWNLGTDWVYDAANQRIGRSGTTYHNLLMTDTYPNLVVGKSYVLEVTAGGGVGVYTSSGSISGLNNGTPTVVHFTYNGGNYPFFYTSSATAWVDNVSIRLADPDRSVRGKGLAVYGTVQKSEAVAGSGGLMAYSGFSASNYLQQPYNSAMDVGTGDFAWCGVFSSNSTANQYLLWRQDLALTGERMILGQAQAGGYFGIWTASTTLFTPTVYANTGFHSFVAQRKGGVLSIWIDGREVATGVTSTTNVTNAAAVTRIGIDVSSLKAWTGSAAMIQFYNRALSADEIPLLSRLQMAALHGKTTLRSGDIKAIAADPYSGDLHVLTAVGRQVFDGKTLQETEFEAITGKTKIAVHNGTVSLS